MRKFNFDERSFFPRVLLSWRQRFVLQLPIFNTHLPTLKQFSCWSSDDALSSWIFSFFLFMTQLPVKHWPSFILVLLQHNRQMILLLFFLRLVFIFLDKFVVFIFGTTTASIFQPNVTEIVFYCCVNSSIVP